MKAVLKSKGLFFLILGLAIIATVLFFWKLFFSKPERPLPAPSTPTVGPTPTSGFQTEVPPEEKKAGPGPQEVIESLKERFPLYDWVPYTSENFYLVYKGDFHLKAVLKEDTPELRQEILDWIRSKGVDPATHKIDWEVKP